MSFSNVLPNLMLLVAVLLAYEVGFLRGRAGKSRLRTPRRPTPDNVTGLRREDDR